MTASFDGYEVFPTWELANLSRAPRRDARREFERIMAIKDARIAQLSTVVESDGVQLTTTDAGIERLDNWFAEGVSPDPSQPGLLTVEWYSIAFDIWMFLGDAMIARGKSLAWEFMIRTKRSESYQSPVVGGFHSGEMAVEGVDFWPRIPGYGHRLVASRGSVRSLGTVEVDGVRLNLDSIERDFQQRPSERSQFMRWIRYVEEHEQNAQGA